MESGQDQAARSFEEAKRARASGDLPGAQAALAVAMAHDAGPLAVYLGIFQAQILEDGGFAEPAQRVLQGVSDAHPSAHWPLYHLARIAFASGRAEEAAAHLAQAEALDPEGRNAAIGVLAARLLQADGALEAATARLTKVLDQHPDAPAATRLLAGLHAKGTGTEALQKPATDGSSARGAASGPETRQADTLKAARAAIRDGHLDNATRLLTDFVQNEGGTVPVWLLLAQTHRRAGRDTDEAEALCQAVACNPRHPDLLWDIFDARARTVVRQTAEDIVAVLAPDLDPPVPTRLLAQIDLRSLHFGSAVARLRGFRQARRAAPDALVLAKALLGALHLRLGLRYLRFCLRRWPDNPGFRSLHVIWGLKLGGPEDVAARITAAAPHVSPSLLASHQLMQQAYRNDMDAVVDAYAALRARGQVTWEHRTILTKMLYTRQDMARFDDVLSQVGHPVTEVAPLLHRAGEPGAMMLELELEKGEWRNGWHGAGLADWVRARPHSTVAAIRFVDHWRASSNRRAAQTSGDAQAPQKPPGAIPKQVFQYWNAAKLPEWMQRPVQSWANLQGVTHRLLDRAAAQNLLAKTFDADWARAFRLAADPRQEADLLRLCLLWRFGGIWADTDDVLYGDLDRLLRAGPGLVLYREPAGGALGNNLMLSPPEHPILRLAAEMAVEALLCRDNEAAWNKTGPGLLTRAVAQYLVQHGDAGGLTILDWPEVAGVVASHSPMPHKIGGKDKDLGTADQPSDPVWATLYRHLREGRADGT